MNKIFEKLEVETNYKQVKVHEKDWEGRNMILVTMNNFEEKFKIMRSKKKLVETDCCIENDMSREERQIQADIRWRQKAPL